MNTYCTVTEDNRFLWWKKFNEIAINQLSKGLVDPSTKSHQTFSVGMTGVDIHCVVSLGKARQYAQCCIYIKKSSLGFRDFLISKEQEIFNLLGFEYIWRETRGYDTRVAEIIPNLKLAVDFNMKNEVEYEAVINWQVKTTLQLLETFTALVTEYKK